MKQRKRTGAQDSAKGLMIIAVVFFHCYLMTFEKSTDALGNFNILIALFPFLLSVFFFYAGYNYQQGGRTVKEHIIRRAKQLLIPMLGALVISTVLISSLELIYDHGDIGATFLAIWNSILHGLMSDPLAVMIGWPHNGGEIYQLYLALGLLWFLYALFICSLFFYPLVRFTNKKLETLISVDILLLVIAFCMGQFLGVYLPYTVQCYPVIIAIMLTAAYLRQSHFLNRRILTKKASIRHAINMVIAEGIIAGTCLACHYQFGALLTGSLPGGMFDPVMKGFDAIIAFIFSIIGSYFIHTLCRLLKYIPVFGTVTQWIGNHSAIFYLFHPIFIDLVAIVIFQKKRMWGLGQAFFYVFVVVALISGVCLLLDIFIKKKHLDKEYLESLADKEDETYDDDLDDIIVE